MPLNTTYIRSRRLQLGLSQAEAAELAGFPNLQKWSQFECGRIADPQLSSIEALAKALKCGAGKLIEK